LVDMWGGSGTGRPLLVIRLRYPGAPLTPGRP